VNLRNWPGLSRNEQTGRAGTRPRMAVRLQTFRVVNYPYEVKKRHEFFLSGSLLLLKNIKYHMVIRINFCWHRNCLYNKRNSFAVSSRKESDFSFQGSGSRDGEKYHHQQNIVVSVSSWEARREEEGWHHLHLY